MLTHAGLFSGIGGFSLAAQWMGWRNVFEVELDPFCRQVLHKNFPQSQLFEDVCTFDGLPFRGRIDVLSGGFPCQPWSDAGKKLGTADPRHLWPQFLRIIREVQPRFVVGENVRGLLSWGEGVQFEAVCTDLEVEGYEVQPLILPAAGVDAIHSRDRIWFVAHRYGQHGEWRESAAEQARWASAASDGRNGRTHEPLAEATADPSSRRWQSGIYGQGSTHVWQADESGNGRAGYAGAGLWPTESPILPSNDGVSCRLVQANRPQILKASGNAIVPQVAYQIFQAIELTLDTL